MNLVWTDLDAKYLLAIPAWFYIVRLVISNVYLNSLGLVSFDVLKTRYISVGILGTIFSAFHLFLYVQFNLPYWGRC